MFLVVQIITLESLSSLTAFTLPSNSAHSTSAPHTQPVDTIIMDRLPSERLRFSYCLYTSERLSLPSMIHGRRTFLNHFRSTPTCTQLAQRYLHLMDQNLDEKHFLEEAGKLVDAAVEEIKSVQAEIDAGLEISVDERMLGGWEMRHDAAVQSIRALAISIATIEEALRDNTLDSEGISSFYSRRLT